MSLALEFSLNPQVNKTLYSTDSALTSSRQAVSEGLTAAHQLANEDWKNKPIIHEKAKQKAKSDDNNNENNFLLDEARPGEMLKQESLFSVLKEKRPLNVGKSNSLLHEAQPISMHHHESPLSPMMKVENNSTSFLTKIQGTTSKGIWSLKNSTRMYNHSLAGLSLSRASVVLQKESIKKNVSEPHSDSHDDWFTNVKLAKPHNVSLETSRADSPRNTQLSRKMYTAVDNLKTLFSRLSLFKAPLKNVKGNTSLLLLTLSSLLHDNATLRKLIYKSPKLVTKDVLGKAKTMGLRPSEDTSDLQGKAQQELLKSLMKADFMLGERSVIKQNRKSQGDITSTKLPLRRSKKVSKKESTERFLTESGAKLLPAHIFSPLGSAFKDLLEHSSTPAPKTSPTTTPSPIDLPQPPTSSPLIVPTQEGQIVPVTQSHVRKEPTTSPILVPTQSGMIATPRSSSEEKEAENMVSPTSRDSKGSFSSEFFIPSIMSTKSHDVLEKSGSISDQTSPVKNIFPTEAPLLPTQTRFVPSRKQKNVFWTGLAENNSERKNMKINIQEQRLYSHESARSKTIRPKTLVSHFQRKPIQWINSVRNGAPNAVSNRMVVSWPVHFRKRRQLLVPVPFMQNNNNPQQFAGQTLLPGQMDGQVLLPNMPQLPQLQQSVQQFLPTQPLQEFVPQIVQSRQAMSPISLLGQPGKHDHNINNYGLDSLSQCAYHKSVLGGQNSPESY